MSADEMHSWLEGLLDDYMRNGFDDIVVRVTEKFNDRSEAGIEKYGTTLAANKGPRGYWLNHLQEELGETKTLKTIEDAEEYVRIKHIAWLSRERLVPKIVEKTTGRMIGQLWIEPKWDRMILEIGYFVEEKSQGNGYVTEAVKKMIEFLFTGLGANKLEIHAKATNTRSTGVAKRCGFTKEAQLRERGRTTFNRKVVSIRYICWWIYSNVQNSAKYTTRCL